MNLKKLSKQKRLKILIDVFRWVQKQGGFLPKEAYWERIKTFPTIYHECINFAPSNEGTGWEVLMDLRQPDDPYYANQYGTQGGTVMMRQNLKELFKRHSEKESFVYGDSEFHFCGVVTTPNTKRDHAYIAVFGRTLSGKPKLSNGVWLPLNQLNSLPIIPSNLEIVKMATAVILQKKEAYYFEFSETD